MHIELLNPNKQELRVLLHDPGRDVTVEYCSYFPKGLSPTSPNPRRPSPTCSPNPLAYPLTSRLLIALPYLLDH